MTPKLTIRLCVVVGLTCQDTNKTVAQLITADALILAACLSLSMLVLRC